MLHPAGSQAAVLPQTGKAMALTQVKAAIAGGAAGRLLQVGMQQLQGLEGFEAQVMNM